MIRLLISLAMVVTASASVGTKFYVFREDCYETQDWTDFDCLKFTGKRVVGLVSSFGAMGLKVPQIQKILAKSSVEGINKYGLYMDLINLLSLVGNSWRLGIGFGVWGGPFFVWFQNVVIIVLCWRYSKTTKLAEVLTVILLTSATAYLMFSGTPWMTDEAWQLVSSSQTVMILFSTLPQIWQNFTAKSTGQLAFISQYLLCQGSGVKLYLVSSESDDFCFLLPFAVKFTMYSVILLQFALYWNSKGGVKVE